jgi:hypothetical protein
VSNAANQQLGTGPSDRAVAFARAWLVIWGVVLIAFGVGIVAAASNSEWLLGGSIIALGISHFIAARYASARVAVFFAWVGP